MRSMPCAGPNMGGHSLMVVEGVKMNNIKWKIEISLLCVLTDCMLHLCCKYMCVHVCVCVCVHVCVCVVCVCVVHVCVLCVC